MNTEVQFSGVNKIMSTSVHLSVDSLRRLVTNVKLLHLRPIGRRWCNTQDGKRNLVFNPIDTQRIKPRVNHFAWPSIEQEHEPLSRQFLTIRLTIHLPANPLPVQQLHQT